MQKGMLFVLLLATIALAEDGRCHQCGKEFPLHEAVFWGPKTFCGKACKDTFWEAYRDKQWRCRTCNEKVQDPDKTRGLMVDNKVRQGWDGLCDDCRKAAPNGTKSAAVATPETKPDEPKRSPSKRPYRRPLPTPSHDEEGGIPPLTLVLGGALLLLVGARFYASNKKAKQAD